ncbi:ABC transporter permease [Flexivirga caeni]|uniref:ABC transporter permease n=1 Tax=Flexivirga caeni TaxID=2294115 RepID=A0A3M9M6D3_9MICO|nr:ABC transporter permease [Flexivirga caeni]RNI21121.1 ABC transporter permease [Flexivirga caeni]
MSDMTIGRTLRLLPAQIRLSQQVYWRDIAFAIMGAVMPLVLGLAPAALASESLVYEGVSQRAWLLSSGISAAMLFVVYNVINSAARRREQRIYKRLRCTPAPAHSILLGEAISAAIPAIGQVAIIMVAGHYWLGVAWPVHWPLVIATVVIGLISLAMLAFGVSGLLPSGEIATWIVTPVLAGLMYLSGAFGAIPDNPVLRSIHRYVPSAELTDAMRIGYLGRDVHGFTVGAPVDLAAAAHAAYLPLLLLLVWAAVGLMLFNSFFRWEPRAR